MLKKLDKKISVSYLPYAFFRLLAIMLMTELLFHIFSFHVAFESSTMRIILFCAAFSGCAAALTSFLKVKPGLWLIGFFGWFTAIYAVFELGIFDMMGNYTAIKNGGGMAGAVLDYVPLFFKSLNYWYLTILLFPILAKIIDRFFDVQKTEHKKWLIVTLCAACLLNGIAVWNVSQSDLFSLYDYPKYSARAIREFGISRYFLRDLSTLFHDETITLSEQTSTPEPVEDQSETEETAELHRTIDDTEWKALKDAETNTDIATVDSYLMNRTITDYNDETAALKDKNLIYIMVEALDYIAIDETLTPTLYKMKEEGWDFTNHYVPKYSCTTGESEFISEVSLVPESDVCTPNQYVSNTFSESLFSVFSDAGYQTQAYHNWKDEFYDRRDLYASEGCAVYKNYDDLDYDSLYGWQSDYQMMELTVDEWINEDRFLTLYVTSSTHFPYDISSDLGDKYLNEINAVYPDYNILYKRYLSKAMELDKAMEYLLQRLQEAGKLDDTAIVFFGDHHPLNMGMSIISEYCTEVDRTVGLNEDRGPLVIYSPSLGQRKIDTVNSTFDILPTIFNLYDLNYDPRLYVGTDIFASDKEKLVIFPTGDWISEKGIYYYNTGEFEPFDSETADENYISETENTVQNLFSVSSLIYRTDYFNARSTITKPKDSLTLAQENLE